MARVKLLARFTETQEHSAAGHSGTPQMTPLGSFRLHLVGTRSDCICIKKQNRAKQHTKLTFSCPNTFSELITRWTLNWSWDFYVRLLNTITPPPTHDHHSALIPNLSVTQRQQIFLHNITQKVEQKPDNDATSCGRSLSGETHHKGSTGSQLAVTFTTPQRTRHGSEVTLKAPQWSRSLIGRVVITLGH